MNPNKIVSLASRMPFSVASAAHTTEAVSGGLMLAGHAMSAYAQHTIGHTLDRIAATARPTDISPAQPYPNFSTPASKGSQLVEKLVLGAATIGVVLPITEVVRHIP
ncbi:MAG TPA: hypothetical protein VLF43_01695 [Candidatus Saccharimonadales bacterium]|nr:hypothetical protein [Candidatus Saccharimonadales bacterium]